MNEKELEHPFTKKQGEEAAVQERINEYSMSKLPAHP